MTSIKDKLFLLVLLGCAVLSACQVNNSTPVVIVAASPTLPPTIIPPPPTPTPTALPTPLPSPTAILGCSDLHGQIESVQVVDKNFPKPIDLNIYLPPCYSKQYPGGYPVLYLLHGQSFTNDQWIRLRFPETADADFVAGKIKPYIIVMPREEYYLKDWFDSSFGRQLVESVLPWVESHYATCNQRSCRAIGGLSRGALWVAVLGLNYWDLFGVMGMHSLPNSPFAEAYIRDHFKAMAPQGYSKIYMDMGNTDGLLSGARVFTEHLKKYKIPFEWHLNPGGHSEDYWGAHVPEYVLWYGNNFKQ